MVAQLLEINTEYYQRYAKHLHMLETSINTNIRMQSVPIQSSENEILNSRSHIGYLNAYSNQME